MTSMKAVNLGMNKYCGPAVLSILTGKSTDECANVISRITGNYKVQGVWLEDLLKAANKLGFTSEKIEPANTLFATMHRLAAKGDGMYIVTITGHFVVIEVNEGKLYFCDNHTKEPIPAASSARMMQRCLAAHKVIRKPPPQVIRRVKEYKLSILNSVIYDDPDFNIHTREVRTFNSEAELRQYLNYGDPK